MGSYRRRRFWTGTYRSSRTPYPTLATALMRCASPPSCRSRQDVLSWSYVTMGSVATTSGSSPPGSSVASVR
jgi:hypothetical protein